MENQLRLVGDCGGSSYLPPEYYNRVRHLLDNLQNEISGAFTERKRLSDLSESRPCSPESPITLSRSGAPPFVAVLSLAAVRAVYRIDLGCERVQTERYKRSGSTPQPDKL